MKKGKGIAAALAAIMTVVACTGCGNSGQEAEVDLTGEIPESLKIFSNVGANITGAGGSTFNDCLTFQLLEEKTGCHVEWDHPASGALTERFNMLMVSGEYPDAIVYNWLQGAPGGVESYVEDGVIVDLTPYIEECMPNFSKILEENPQIKKDIVSDSGKIYFIPYIRLDQDLCVFQGPVMREDWLKKLNLEAPKDMDELYTVLKAFKEQDPNGNGQADEIPMGAAGFDNVLGVGPLLWGFGANYDFQVKDGKIVYGPTTAEFKEGLGYIAKLYSEGLIDPDYVLDTRAKMDAKFTNNTLGFSYGYQPTTYYASMNDGRKVSGIGYPKAKDGKNYCYNVAYTQPVVVAASLAVTTANKNVAGTLKWLDELYGGDGLNYANYGKEGVSYEMKDGEPTFTDYIDNPSNGKTRAQQIALTCAVRDSAFPMGQTWDFYKQTLAPWGIESIETWMADNPYTDNIVPLITMTAEENSRYTEIMNAAKTYMQEEANKVITGKSSIDNWDSVVAQLKTMGIDEATELQDAAYQRYLKR